MTSHLLPEEQEEDEEGTEAGTIEAGRPSEDKERDAARRSYVTWVEAQVDLTFMSGMVGGPNISWGELMEMDVVTRDIIKRFVDDFRERASEKVK